MKAWVFQTGEPLPIDEGHLRAMRAINLCGKLQQAGHQVTLWSSDFHHVDKRFRFNKNQSIKVSDRFEIRLITSCGYKKNIGLGRLIDHAMLALNLKKLLRREAEIPDVAFIGYPPIDTAYVFSNWLVERNVPFVLDVKDQWPTIFIDPVPEPLKPIARLLIYPYTYLARQTMRKASCISAMADGFLDWSLTFAGRPKSDDDRVYPLTSPTGQVSAAELQQANCWWDEQGVTDNSVNRFYFVGSFSPAFDFTQIKTAAVAALDNGDNIQFVLCGEGGSAAKVKDMMTGLTNVILPGWIDRPKIEALAARSMAALAPYRNTEDFMISIPNKIIDSLSLGQPILSPLKGEVRSLIEKYEIGKAYEEDEERGLYYLIKALIDKQMTRNAMSQNARDLYNSRFSFEGVYGALVTHLEQLAADSNRMIKHEN